MGKGLAVAVSAYILLGIFYQGVRSSSELESRRKVSNSQYETIARNAAISGLNAARQYVSDYWTSSSWTPTSKKTSTFSATHGEASYSAEVAINGTKAYARVISRIGNASAKESIYSARAEFVREVDASDVPDFMMNAVGLDGNFTIERDFTMDSFDGSTNANVHSNGNIEIKNGDVSIHGFGYHKGNAFSENGDPLTAIFTPYSNPNGESVTQKASEIVIPSFKAEDHWSKATVRYYSDLQIGGTVLLGTKDNPEIIYVEGNVKTTSDVVFSGYGVFILTGTVEVYHNVSQTGTAEESNVGFYTNGNIYVADGGLSLAGQWLANGNAKMSANTHLTGSVVLKGNFELLGPMHMTYRPPTASLTDPFWTGGGGDPAMRLVSFYEE